MLSSILTAYGIPETSGIHPLDSGLINHTWKVTDDGASFILQRINANVFKNPHHLADNIKLLDAYLTTNSPGYLFVAPIATREGKVIVEKEGGYYRLFPFVKGSHTLNVVSSADQAFEAALQFGKFTRLLSGFQSEKLHITIPDFHNLTLRYKQFEDAINGGNAERIKQSKGIISRLADYISILHSFARIQKSAFVKRRVTHHDTKISNVLFDKNGKGMCVIDLDTVMPGYFISDVGDMLRTYLSPANEEEKDFTKIEVRDDFFKGIVQGYLSHMGDELTGEEQELILYSGMFLIYMQTIRFLADYCNDDRYYGARYEEQNFVRAGNQLTLLERLDERKEILLSIISRELKTKSYMHLK